MIFQCLKALLQVNLFPKVCLLAFGMYIYMKLINEEPVMPPFPNNLPLPPPPPPGFLPNNLPPPPPSDAPGMNPPPPPPGFPPANFPLYPPGFPPGNVFISPPNLPMPPPPPGFPHPPFPPPPPGFFPRRHQSASVMQDPLSSIPHQTFQAHRENRAAPPPSPHPSLPPNPTLAAPSSATPARQPTAADVAAATVFAAPQLRDLKKEATAFMPSSLKRKKAGGAVAGSSKINAAPNLGPSSDETQSESAVGPARPDLLSALKDQFGSAPAVPAPTNSRGNKAAPSAAPKGKDDYAKFVEEMGDILGSSS
jgi:hypothetical protein